MGDGWDRVVGDREMERPCRSPITTTRSITRYLSIPYGHRRIGDTSPHIRGGLPGCPNQSKRAEEQRDDQRPTLLLVDGYGLIFRAYYAIKNEISTSKGEVVNAVFGFASMLLDVLRRESPDHAIIALEGGPTFRDEEFAEYKANRGAMPDDLRPQVERVRQLIDALNIPIEERPGYEADDVIGSLSRVCGDRGDVRVIIVTGDSDLLQLVDENTTVVLPGAQRFGELRYFDPAAVHARYGFGPEHVADYKALVGDTSDNIPGVSGIGEKTAKALIAQYGDVEAIIAHLDEITPPRARNALAAGVDEARRSKRLTTIVRDLPIEIDLDRSHVGNYDREAIIELFRELEFRTLATRLPELRADRVEVAPRVERPDSMRTIVRTRRGTGAAGAARARDGSLRHRRRDGLARSAHRQPGRHRHRGRSGRGVLHPAAPRGR